MNVKELAAIFGRWLDVLEKRLDQGTYLEVVEDLRHVTESQRIPVGQEEEEDDGDLDPDEAEEEE